MVLGLAGSFIAATGFAKPRSVPARCLPPDQVLGGRRPKKRGKLDQAITTNGINRSGCPIHDMHLGSAPPGRGRAGPRQSDLGGRGFVVLSVMNWPPAVSPATHANSWDDFSQGRSSSTAFDLQARGPSNVWRPTTPSWWGGRRGGMQERRELRHFRRANLGEPRRAPKPQGGKTWLALIVKKNCGDALRLRTCNLQQKLRSRPRCVCFLGAKADIG